MKTEEKIKVMQAFVDGKAVQFRKAMHNLNSEWEDFDSCIEPSWEWGSLDWRIKPQPKIIYVNEYSDGKHMAFDKKRAAHPTPALHSQLRSQIPYIELTEEIKQKLGVGL